MSGSIKWMVYASDDGDNYAVKIDESNGEALGFGDYTVDSTEAPIRKGTRMRYINCLGTEDGATVRRRFFVGNPDAFQAFIDRTQTTVTINGTTYFVTSTRGEQNTLPFSLDTGKQDGDVT